MEETGVEDWGERSMGYKGATFRVEERPFPHIKVAPVLSQGSAEELLRLLDDMIWRRTIQQYYEFNIPAVSDEKERLCHHLSRWRTENVIRCYLGKNLSASLGREAEVDIHQYLPKTGVGVHTDGPAREARFVLNLNRGWYPDQGGVWILSENSDLKQPVSYIPPLHNTGFGFLTTAGSYHALSQRFSSTSYALVFRFKVE